MTTSPDESRPTGVSAIVVPDVLRPRIDDFLRSLGCTIEEFPWDASPVPMVIAIPRDPDAERKSLSDTIDLGRSTSPEDLGITAESFPSLAWTPISTQPGLRPLVNPHTTLPVYRVDQPDARLAVGTCSRCDHSHSEHEGYAYAHPHGATRSADITVVICGAYRCACLSRVEPPTPV